MGKKAPKKTVTQPVLANASYTSEQLCAALGVERTTLWRWRKEGLPWKQRGARYYYLGKDVQKFLFGGTAGNRTKPK